MFAVKRTMFFAQGRWWPIGQNHIDIFVRFAIVIKNKNVYLYKLYKDWRIDRIAKNTDISLWNQIVYSVYIRSHTPEGTFRAVISDLDRIKVLGVDIIWFLPIHPIGIMGKRGTPERPFQPGLPIFKYEMLNIAAISGASKKD